MNPRPIQSPRPPIMVGALGPVMIRHAARFADTWNSLSFRESFDEQVAETRERVALMDAACEALGRDRDTLRRSYTMFDARARPRGGAMDYYESVERFEEMVSQVLELGMDEISLYYPLDERQVPTFERIARDVLPRLRATVRPGPEPRPDPEVRGNRRDGLRYPARRPDPAEPSQSGDASGPGCGEYSLLRGRDESDGEVLI